MRIPSSQLSRQFVTTVPIVVPQKNHVLDCSRHDVENFRTEECFRKDTIILFFFWCKILLVNVLPVSWQCWRGRDQLQVAILCAVGWSLVLSLLNVFYSPPPVNRFAVVRRCRFVVVVLDVLGVVNINTNLVSIGAVCRAPGSHRSSLLSCRWPGG